MKSLKTLLIPSFMLLAIVSCSVTLTKTAAAAEFDPSYIVSDSEITDYKSMDLDDIQKFLSNRSGTLSNYAAPDKEGMIKTAAQAFFETAQRWLVNPKYLLLLVQKEQSLLTDQTPTQGQYDRATGYGCPDSGGCDDRWKGFYKQVNSAAAQTRYYMDNINEFNYQPNKTYTIDDKEVTIKNVATAGLYNYTPHLHGNLNLWNLWNQYFSRKWPDGTLIQADDDVKTYLIENGKRREIISKAVFASRFDPRKVVQISQIDINTYEEGIPIKYLNYSLLQDSQGNIYMIIDDAKRKFETTTLMKTFGFNEDNLIKVSNTELAQYRDGNPISAYSFYPTGIITQDPKTKILYQVISGGKRPIINQEILKADFPNQPIKQLTSAELDKYLTGDPVTLPDGWLIKSKTDSAVYVISKGKRLPIFSSEIFTRMKYSWSNIKVVSDQTLAVHQLGQTITGDW